MGKKSKRRNNTNSSKSAVATRQDARLESTRDTELQQMREELALLEDEERIEIEGRKLSEQLEMKRRKDERREQIRQDLLRDRERQQHQQHQQQEMGKDEREMVVIQKQLNEERSQKLDAKLEEPAKQQQQQDQRIGRQESIRKLMKKPSKVTIDELTPAIRAWMNIDLESTNDTIEGCDHGFPSDMFESNKEATACLTVYNEILTLVVRASGALAVLIHTMQEHRKRFSPSFKDPEVAEIYNELATSIAIKATLEGNEDFAKQNTAALVWVDI